MARPKSFWLLGIVGLLCLASGCNRTTASNPNAGTAGSVAASPTVAPEASKPETALTKPLGAEDFFPNPMVSNGTVQPATMPNLIPPTTTAERMPQIVSGRPDPFASLGLMPTVSQKPVVNTAPPVVSAVPVVATPPQIAALPPISVFPAPAPLPELLPAPVNSGELPNVTVPSSVKPYSLAEAIQISGVVEVAGKTNVILQVPNEHTSRYAAVGERLGNGKVLIKRVEMGLEPVVILEQEGREIARSVGSAIVGAL
jgi:hypothetical protein